jgi:GAF domain-containing protein
VTDPDFAGARYLRRPQDPDLTRRWDRLRRLGIGEHADREFDEVAQKLAAAAGAPYAMVNFIGDREQFFAGLYPASEISADAAAAIMQAEAVGRTMPLDHGFCPHVVERKLALPLDDICDYPRFAANPVVAKLGIRSYLGAPLIDHNNVTLGTVCVVVPNEPRSWGDEGVELIKATAADVVKMINRRDEQRRGYPS